MSRTRSDHAQASEVAVPLLPTGRTCPFDPPPRYRTLRDEGPITRLRLPDGALGWLVTSFAEARKVLADNRFGTTLIQVAPGQDRTFNADELVVPPGNFAALDPPAHTGYRKLVTGPFTANRVNRMVPWLTKMAERQLDRMMCGGGPADLVTDFAQPLSSLVICELVGVPDEHRAAVRRHSVDALSPREGPESQAEAFGLLEEDLRDVVRAARAGRADGVLGDLVRADPPLTDEELITISALLMVTAHETTSNMIALGMFALFQHPEQLAALRAGPDLPVAAVDELLRFLTIVQFGLTRIALEDVRLGDTVVRAGERVIVAAAAANRDPAAFADPDLLDVRRSRSPHLAFGFGVHQCIGAHLARSELRIGLAVLLRLPNLRLAVPPESIVMRDTSVIYGVRSLPVTWDRHG